MAARTAPTSPWRSSASTSRPRGLGLHNDLQTEHSIVANNVGVLLMLAYGTEEQKKEWVDGLLEGSMGFAFGITEPEHGSDATHMDTNAVRDGNGWRINGMKTWNTGIHKAKHDLIFARSSGKAGDGGGITAFLVPTKSDGFKLEEMLWTFNMPTDHGRISLTNVWVPDDAIFGGEGRGLQVVQHFFNENRIRQAASSLGAAQFCIDESVKYANVRKPFGKPLSSNQGIQFPLVELQTQCEMLRALIHKTAWGMDTTGNFSVSDKVSMCNYWANRLCCEAADRRCRCTADWVTRATSRSSTSIATTGATASPRAPRKFRCAASPATCSAS